MKNIMIILLSFLLVGCTTNDKTPTPSPSETPLPTTQAKQTHIDNNLNDLIINGEYFNFLMNEKSKIDISYTDAIATVTVTGDYQIIATLNPSSPSYSITYPDVKINYIKDKEKKDAILKSTYINSEDHIIAALNTSDNKQFDIYFDQDKSKIISNDDQSEITFTDNLNKEILTSFRYQWAERMLFENNMIHLDNQIKALKQNPKSFEIRKVSAFYDSVPIPYNWYLYPEYHEVKVLQSDFAMKFGYIKDSVASIQGWDLDKIYNNLALIILSDLSNYDGSYVDPSSLISPFFTIDYNYMCEDNRCANRKDNEDRMIAVQGITYAYPLIMTEEHFLHNLNVVFGIQLDSIIDQTKVLDNGLVQSSKEKTFVGYNGIADGFFDYIGFVVDELSSSGDTITLAVTVYQTEYNMAANENKNVNTLAIQSKTGLVIPDNSYTLENMAEFVRKDKQNYDQWEVTLKKTDDSNFYFLVSSYKY